MTTDLDDSRDPLTEASVPALQAQDEDVSDAESEVDSAEDVATPNPTAEAPPGFLRLKEYCDSHGIKNSIDLTEPGENICIDLKNGKTSRSVYIGSEKDAEALLEYPLEKLVFLSDYVAICSYEGGWIEAAVRGHGAIQRPFVGRRRIFGSKGARSDEPSEIAISEVGRMTLRLTEKRGILSLFDYISPLYLRIEDIGIKQHDQAVNLLEDLSNSLFMQIDFKFDYPLTLSRDRFSTRRLIRSRGRLDEDNQLLPPRFSYDQSPSSLYWYARSAASMTLLQFLAFYQCVEFFFPQYSRQATIAKIKNVLKDPTFDATKDSYVNNILNATLDGRRGSLLDERKQLGATLAHCVDATALLDFLNENDERKQYFAKDCKKISEKKITLVDEGLVVEQTVERIYDIRCKVVHTKNLDSGDGSEMILPFSEEADLLADDVELMKFLARKVLIASSGPLAV